MRRNERLVSRTLKDIPNTYTRQLLSSLPIEGFDGELICGSPHGEGVFSRATSAFMSHGGEPNFTYHVFDLCDMPDTAYFARLDVLKQYFKEYLAELVQVKLVEQFRVSDMEHLDRLESLSLAQGYEGLIVRDPMGPYKYGRSTLKEGIMLKVKRFKDSEARIIGFEEAMHNDNEATIDSRGLQQRGSSQANRRPAGRLGAFQVEDVHNPQWRFNIGSGFDHTFARMVWDNQAAYIGLTVKYKYLAIGMVDKPRHPIFLSFRHKDDL